MRTICAIATVLSALIGPAAIANPADQDGLNPEARQSPPSRSARVSAERVAPNFRLTEDEVSFPFVVVRGIPFVEATINGVRGKLMLDTGAQKALSLNSNRIPLTGGKEAGNGMFGSGQRFATLLHANVETVDIGGFSFRDVRDVESQEAPMLEAITPDFAGWLGFNFWRGYTLKLDYTKNIATFHRDEAQVEGRSPKFLAGETLVGAIHYEKRNLPNIPVVRARIGSQSFDGLFDTGNSGYIWIDAELQKQLTAAGKIKPAEQGSERVTLEGITIDGAGVYSMSVEPLPPPFPAATPIGTTTPNVIAFGHSFLSQYKTVWDFTGQTIYLLEK